VPADELDAVSLAAARRIADLKPEVATAFKRVLNQIGLDQFDRAIEEESRVQRMLGRDDVGR
jgi:2-(1,2-epoxy-1,2-dihydrophenyl)acetyl-CoA isomerase